MDVDCLTNCTQGWTAPPTSRGSINILWASGTILILCSWSCVCCNLPSPHESNLRTVVRKLWLTAISIIGPEFLLYIAMTQWVSARQSVKHFHRLGYQKWTMQHAFLADMGGFHLQTAGTESYPLSTKSLIYLIEEGAIPKQQVQEVIMFNKDLIEDRNKSDLCTRVIATFQTIWFTCNVLARYIEGLTVTTLEITVIGFLLPTLVTQFCWWHKPRDVKTVHTISMSVPLSSIVDRVGASISTKGHHGPFDHIERNEFHGSVLFRYWINLLKRLVNPRFGGDDDHTRIRQRRSDNDIYAFKHWKYGWIEVVPTIPYLAVNFVAWNSSFPTRLECVLWRAASVAMASAFLLGAMIEVIFLITWPAESEKQILNLHRQEADLLRTQPRTSLKSWKRVERQGKLWLQAFRNNSISDDPSVDVSLRLLFPASILAALYLISRFYMLVEDVAAFRSMPSDTFQVVNWTQFLPHFE